MSLLVRERRAAVLTGEELFSRRRATSYSGQLVTSDRSLRHSAVWGCLSVISEAFLSTPLAERREDSAGLVSFHTPPAVFYDPTPDLTWESWIWQQAWALAQHGRCYGWVATTDNRNYPTSLVPLDDRQVTWRHSDRGWVTEVDGDEVQRWPLGRLWHCPLYVTPKYPMGLNPITYHAETIGVGLAAAEFGGRFFGDGAHPTAIFTSEKDPGVKGAARLKAKIAEVLSGNREPLVLPHGTKMERWQTPPNESQFLDTMRYSGEDVCRIFGVPPGKVWLAISGQNVTYTNTADANNDWRISGLSRYVRTLESRLSRLTPGGQRRRLVFDFKGFLRADLAARAAAYKTFAEIGDLTGTPVMFPNEMRAEEGLGPVPGGDEFIRKAPTTKDEEKDPEP